MSGGHNFEPATMSEQLYSAEEAAQILGLQVRTVRNYVREGRLPGVRIGKQYRISRADLDAFTGSGLGGAVASGSPLSSAASGAPQTTLTTLEVSSVAQVEGIDPEAADRAGRTLSVLAADRSTDGPL